MEAVVAATSMAELWIGEAFALGKGRAGGVEQLAEIGKATRIHRRAVERVRTGWRDQQRRVRQAIQLGDVSLANGCSGVHSG